MEDSNNGWKSPLPNFDWSIPLGKYHPAGFGARRTYSLHTGVDLYCNHLQPVASVEDGSVVGIRDFSKRSKSPGNNRSRVILIEGASGVCVYGNVRERKRLKVGDRVKAGEIIGKVYQPNKKRRRKNECMLHFELYTKGTRKRVTWSYNFPKPPQLLDPSGKLLDIIKDTQVLYKRRR